MRHTKKKLPYAPLKNKGNEPIKPDYDIIVSVQKDDFEAVSYIVQNSPEDILNVLDAAGSNSLHWSVHLNNHEIFDLLIQEVEDKRAALTNKDNMGRTCFEEAIRNGHERMINKISELIAPGHNKHWDDPQTYEASEVIEIPFPTPEN